MSTDSVIRSKSPMTVSVRTLLECIEEFLSGLIVDGKLYSGERVIVEPDGEKEVILRGA